MKARILGFVRENVVMSVAFVAAAVTCFIVPPDGAYLGYVDVKTIACLFSILAVVGAMRNQGMFQYAARKIIDCFSTSRAAVAALVGVTLVVSMVATNDMALIMMLPLSAATLLAAGWGRLLPFTFVMQNLAANLGGMILPFGNPQNLYLFEYFRIEFVAFLGVMALPFAVSVLLIALCCAFGAKNLPACCCGGAKSEEGLVAAPESAAESGANSKPESAAPAAMRADRSCRWLFSLVYILLLALVVLSVFRLVPYAFSTMVVLLTLAIMDRKAIQTLDYGLLFTFVFFFIFAGNMARIPAVDQLLSGLMGQWPLLVSAGLSQVISNVPAAVLLSHFTEGWQALLVGVNIGGAGTIVGSLASLITLQHYRNVLREQAEQDEPSSLPGAGRFIGYMSVYNFAFLAILVFVGLMWL